MTGGGISTGPPPLKSYEGEQVMKDGLQLPMDVVTECIKVAGDTLGK